MRDGWPLFCCLNSVYLSRIIDKGKFGYMLYTEEEIDDLEEYYYAHSKKIQGSIELSAGETIIDVKKFIESQISCIRAQFSSPAVDVYYQRQKS